MKVLVLSDVHIGDPRLKNEDEIVKLILAEKYDAIILNGDFIDTWVCGYKKKIQESPIIKTLNGLKTRIIWLRGNHDQISVHQTIIPKASVQDTHIEVINNEKVLFVHGHQVYAFKNMAWFQKLATGFNLLMHKMFKIDIQKWWRRKKIYNKNVTKKREKIIDKYGKHVSSIIIGHTHVATHQSKVYDGGSILPAGDYIYISDQIHMRRL